jgi:ribosomal protein S18 acetylase RimI-like enzyme
VRTRHASGGDVAAIERIVAAAYGGYEERIGVRPGPLDDDYAARVAEADAFVAVDRDDVVGFVILVLREDDLLVENVAVDPGSQGRGVGRALLAHAEDFAREHGRDVLRLYTHEKMAANLALYARLGYVEEERATVDRFNRVFLVKRLA